MPPPGPVQTPPKANGYDAESSSYSSNSSSSSRSSSPPRFQQMRETSSSFKTDEPRKLKNVIEADPRVQTVGSVAESSSVPITREQYAEYRPQTVSHKASKPAHTVAHQITALLQQPRPLNLIEHLLEDLPQDLLKGLLIQLLPYARQVSSLSHDKQQEQIKTIFNKLQQDPLLEQWLENPQQKDTLEKFITTHLGTHISTYSPKRTKLVANLVYATRVLWPLLTVRVLPPPSLTPNFSSIALNCMACLLVAIAIKSGAEMLDYNIMNYSQLVLVPFLAQFLLQPLLRVLQPHQIQKLPQGLQKKLLEGLQQGLQQEVLLTDHLLQGAQQKDLLQRHLSQLNQLKVLLQCAKYDDLISNPSLQKELTLNLSLENLNSKQQIATLRKALQQYLRQAQEKDLLIEKFMVVCLEIFYTWRQLPTPSE